MDQTLSNKRLVAVVDSDSVHRQKVAKALMSYYDLALYSDTGEALEVLSGSPPALIIVNAQLSPLSPVDFIKACQAEDTIKDIPVVYIADGEVDENITSMRDDGADEVVIKPYPRSVLVKAISAALNTGIEKEWEALPETPRAALQNSVAIFHDIADVLMSGETVEFKNVKENCQPLVDAIETGDFIGILDGVRNHDDYTYAHSMRVATFLTMLGHAAGFKNEDQLLLSSGGLLHDVGKMMIPHNILNKPGKLTDEEFEIMKSHVPETMTYLDKAGDIPRGVKIIAEQHHEKIDGTGYPHGLKGKELNELARMAAVVDVFSALTDRRVYKDPMPAEKAMAIMTEEMNTHLDSNYVKLFSTVLVDEGILK